MNRFLIKKPSSNMGQKTFSKEHKNFMIYFVLIIAIGLGLTNWVNATYQKNYNLAAKDIDQSMSAVKGAYTNILSESDKPADILFFEGVNLMKKNQLELGLMCMEKSVEKDPNWRDSALYLGFTYLKLTESDQQNQRESIQISEISALEKAKFYLEKARNIDPLYAKTHEYLAIVYQKLGDNQNAQLSLKKSQEFSK